MVQVTSVFLYLGTSAALGFALNDFRITHFGLPVGMACFYAGVVRQHLGAFLVCSVLLMATREEFVFVALFLGALSTLGAIRSSNRPQPRSRARTATGWSLGVLLTVVAYLAFVGWARTTLGQQWSGPYPFSFAGGPVLSLDPAVFRSIPELVRSMGALGCLSLLAPELSLPAWIGLLFLHDRQMYTEGFLHHGALFLVLACPAAIVGLARLHRWVSAYRWGTTVATIALLGLVGHEVIAMGARVREWPTATAESVATHALARRAGEGVVTAPAQLSAVLSSRPQLYVYGEADLPVGAMVAESEYVVVLRDDLDGPWKADGVSLRGFGILDETSRMVFARRLETQILPSPSGMVLVEADRAFSIGEKELNPPLNQPWNDPYLVPFGSFWIDSFWIGEYPFPGRGEAWIGRADSGMGLTFSNVLLLLERAQPRFGRRLCTVEELLLAGAGPDNYRWPYGNSWDSTKCDQDRNPAHPIGAFPDCVSPYGVHDITTRSLWAEVDEETRSLYNATAAELGWPHRLPDDLPVVAVHGLNCREADYGTTVQTVHWHHRPGDPWMQDDPDVAFVDDYLSFCADPDSPPTEAQEREFEEVRAACAERVSFEPLLDSLRVMPGAPESSPWEEQPDQDRSGADVPPSVK